MTDLAALCAQFGIDQQAARQALSERAADDDAPWYMQAVLGVGAWVTAIAGLFFVWVFMDLVLEIDEPDLTIAIFGAILFAASLWLLHHRWNGVFSAHVAVAFATAGTLLVAAGIGVPEESLWWAAAATWPLAAVAIWQRRSQLLQFLIVSVALIVSIAAIYEEWNHPITDLAAITIPVGVLLLLYPPRRDLRATAFALLLVPELVGIVVESFDAGWALWRGWPAKIAFLAVFGYLVAVNWLRLADAEARRLALAGGVAAVAAALLLPTGSSAALVLLLLAYTLGSRTLAAIGILAEAYFIWRFYYDLQSTLLTKSVILMSVGAALLLCYGLLAVAQRRRRTS